MARPHNQDGLRPAILHGSWSSSRCVLYLKVSHRDPLIRLSQSSLLKYWEFEPSIEDIKDRSSDKSVRRQSSDSSDRTRVNSDTPSKLKRRWTFRKSKEIKKPVESELSEEKEPVKPKKKMPVIFFDEAHKL